MNAKDYFLLGESIIEEAKQQPQKPSLLLHACCAPCNAYPIEHLAPVFDLTLYFNNSNIYPEAEYVQRLEELKRYVTYYNDANGDNVKLIVPRYDNVEYTQYLSVRKDDKENQERCFMCYERRMREAFAYAEANQFDYMTTVMSISRQKNALKLNEIGGKLQPFFPNTKYLFSNFKKNKGMDRGVELSKIHNMYKQDYCGCVFSFRDAQKRKENHVAKQESEK